MNWTTLFIIVLLNSILCLIQFAVQQIDKKQGKISKQGSYIPGAHQKFLYWEDFKTQTYGDFIFLPLIAYITWMHFHEVGMLYYEPYLLFALAVAAIVGMLIVCLHPSHKPDWGYPSAGKISRGGISHLPYFGAYVAMTIIMITKDLGGNLDGPHSLLLIIGAGGYALTWLLDLVGGKFDPLKKE